MNTKHVFTKLNRGKHTEQLYSHGDYIYTQIKLTENQLSNVGFPESILQAMIVAQLAAKLIDLTEELSNVTKVILICNN